jgi:hypothetical protein
LGHDAAVPVKYSLPGNLGLNIFASDYPTLVKWAGTCGSLVLKVIDGKENSALFQFTRGSIITMVRKSSALWVPGFISKVLKTYRSHIYPKSIRKVEN